MVNGRSHKNVDFEDYPQTNRASPEQRIKKLLGKDKGHSPKRHYDLDKDLSSFQDRVQLRDNWKDQVLAQEAYQVEKLEKFLE